jgi:hypothetical protein
MERLRGSVSGCSYRIIKSVDGHDPHLLRNANAALVSGTRSEGALNHVDNDAMTSSRAISVHRRGHRQWKQIH